MVSIRIPAALCCVLLFAATGVAMHPNGSPPNYATLDQSHVPLLASFHARHSLQLADSFKIAWYAESSPPDAMIFCTLLADPLREPLMLLRYCSNSAQMQERWVSVEKDESGVPHFIEHIDKERRWLTFNRHPNSNHVIEDFHRDQETKELGTLEDWRPRPESKVGCALLENVPFSPPSSPRSVPTSPRSTLVRQLSLNLSRSPLRTHPSSAGNSPRDNSPLLSRLCRSLGNSPRGNTQKETYHVRLPDKSE